MLRQLLAPLGVSMALVAAPVTAAELTETQRRLLNALPSVEQVVAAAPKFDDPVENAMSREIALAHFSDMAYAIVDATPETWDELIRLGQNRYHAARMQEHGEARKALGDIPKTDDGNMAAERKLREVADRIKPQDPGDFYASRAELFESVLTGELRDFALKWHYANGGSSAPLRPTAKLKRWTSSLPGDPSRLLGKVIDVFVAIPFMIWVALLIGWVLLGLRYRTSPFGLDPADPLKLMLGRNRRKQMAYHDGRIVSIQVQERTAIHTSHDVDEFGRRQGADSVQTFRSLTQTIRLRDSSGAEHTIDLRNNPWDVQQGQRLLVVFDEKATHPLFLHNRDSGATRYMPWLESFYRMRPLILIPVWLLTILAATLVSPVWVWAAAICTPVVYLFVMWQLNSQRRRKFVKELIPSIIDATARAGISRA